MSENTTRRKAVDFGRNDIDRHLRYTGHVVGGGAVTPWVNVVTGYDTLAKVRYEDDFRSGSKRSGSIVWQLDENELYVMRGVAVSSRASETYYVSTYDGITEVLDAKQFRAALRRFYPAGAELAAVKAEQARVAQEAAAAAQVEAEKARLVRMQEEAARREATRLEREATLAAEAEKIETEGQVAIEGLPFLKGTPKQVAWATKIRDAVRAKEPKNPALKRASKASYWIENYRTALPR